MDYTTFLSHSNNETIRIDCEMLLTLAKRLIENNDPGTELFMVGAEINGRVKEIIRKLPPKNKI